MIQQMEELLETMAEKTIHEGNMHRISDLIEHQQQSRDLFCRKFSTQLSQAFSSLGKIIDFLINTKP